MRSTGFIAIIAIIMAAIDFYVFQIVKMLCQGSSSQNKIHYFYRLLGSFHYQSLYFLFLPYLNTERGPKIFRNYLFATIVGFFFAKVTGLCFFPGGRSASCYSMGSCKIFFRNTEGDSDVNEGISRSVFLSWLGIGIGGSLISSLVYGFSNKYNYHIRRVPL